MFGRWKGASPGRFQSSEYRGLLRAALQLRGTTAFDLFDGLANVVGTAACEMVLFPTRCGIANGRQVRSLAGRQAGASERFEGTLSTGLVEDDFRGEATNDLVDLNFLDFERRPVAARTEAPDDLKPLLVEFRLPVPRSNIEPVAMAASAAARSACRRVRWQSIPATAAGQEQLLSQALASRSRLEQPDRKCSQTAISGINQREKT